MAAKMVEEDRIQRCVGRCKRLGSERWGRRAGGWGETGFAARAAGIAGRVGFLLVLIHARAGVRSGRRCFDFALRALIRMTRLWGWFGLGGGWNNRRLFDSLRSLRMTL